MIVTKTHGATEIARRVSALDIDRVRLRHTRYDSDIARKMTKFILK